MGSKLAIVVIAFNEESEIEGCLTAAAQARPDDVLVIDSHSTDGTRPKAEALGARVVAHRWLGYGEQRNLALDLTDADWLLFLDADERVTHELAAEIRALVENPGDAAAASMPRWNWFLGRPLRCKNPDRQVRLARRGRFTWGGGIHARMRVDGRIVRFRDGLLHEPWADLDEFLAKKRVHARTIARDAVASGKRFRWSMLLRSFLSVHKHLLLRGGLLEGKRAILYAFGYLIYSLQKALYMLEADIAATSEPRPMPDPLKPVR